MKNDKIIKINEETHRKLKMQASSKGLSIKDYVEYLVDKDK